MGIVPGVERPADELRAVVGDQYRRLPARFDHTLPHLGYAAPADPGIDVNRQARAGAADALAGVSGGPRFGYRRLHILLGREGGGSTRRRRTRLYREEALGCESSGGEQVDHRTNSYARACAKVAAEGCYCETRLINPRLE